MVLKSDLKWTLFKYTVSYGWNVAEWKFKTLQNIYTAFQKFGNALESGALDNIGMNPF